MKNNIFKKLLGITLLFTFATLGVVFTTTGASASTLKSFKIKDGAGTIHSLSTSDYYAAEKNSNTLILQNGSGYYPIKDGTIEFVIDNNATLDIDFNDGKSIRNIKNGHIMRMEGMSLVDAYNYIIFTGITEVRFSLDPNPVDDTRPAIDGQENAVTNVNNPEDVNFFVKLFRAIDDIDGDISDGIVIDEDGYTANKRILGKYPVTISATDNAGNKATLTFYINVVDLDIPVITGNTDIARISYDSTYDVEAFRKTLSITDNYDTLANSAIKLKTNGYDANKTKLGIYDVVFEAKDSSNNTATFTKKVQVYDGVKPSFNGITAFTKGYTKTVSVADIIKDIKATDFIDGDITKDIKVKKDEYTGNANRVGVYNIELEVSDKAGNKAQHNIKVTVTDDKAADWYITNGYTINLAPDATLTRTQIVELLVRNKQVNAGASSRVVYTYDSYTDNVGEPGVYVLGFTITETNGNESSYEYAINVMQSDDMDDNTDTLPDDPSFFKDNIMWIGIAGGSILLLAGLYLVIKKRK